VEGGLRGLSGIPCSGASSIVAGVLSSNSYLLGDDIATSAALVMPSVFMALVISSGGYWGDGGISVLFELEIPSIFMALVEPFRDFAKMESRLAFDLSIEIGLLLVKLPSIPELVLPELAVLAEWAVLPELAVGVGLVDRLLSDSA
jgi:hypothetical protein